MAGIDALKPGEALGLGLLLAGVNPKNLMLAAAAGAGLAQLEISTGYAAGSLIVFVIIGSLTICVECPCRREDIAARIGDLRAVDTKRDSDSNISLPSCSPEAGACTTLPLVRRSRRVATSISLSCFDVRTRTSYALGSALPCAEGTFAARHGYGPIRAKGKGARSKTAGGDGNGTTGAGISACGPG